MLKKLKNYLRSAKKNICEKNLASLDFFFSTVNFCLILQN